MNRPHFLATATIELNALSFFSSSLFLSINKIFLSDLSNDLSKLSNPFNFLCVKDLPANFLNSHEDL